MISDLKLFKNIKLFWDIDGTLLKTNGAAAVPFANAVSEFAGVEVIIDRKKLSGFTDYEIAISLLRSIEITTSLGNITSILENYAKKLPASLNLGVVEKIGQIEQVLKSILEIPEIGLAVGTGNFLPGAKIKLDHVGLMNYFDDNNLFCASENSWSRDLIINDAKNSLSTDQIGIVIGDSPKDILSAKASSLISIAVATGAHSSVELAKYVPNLILNDDWQVNDLIDGIYNLIQNL